MVAGPSDAVNLEGSVVDVVVVVVAGLSDAEDPHGSVVDGVVVVVVVMVTMTG